MKSKQFRQHGDAVVCPLWDRNIHPLRCWQCLRYWCLRSQPGLSVAIAINQLELPCPKLSPHSAHPASTDELAGAGVGRVILALELPTRLMEPFVATSQ